MIKKCSGSPHLGSVSIQFRLQIAGDGRRPTLVLEFDELERLFGTGDTFSGNLQPGTGGIQVQISVFDFQFDGFDIRRGGTIWRTE